MDDPSSADKRRSRPEAYCKLAFEETIMQVRGTEELKRVRVAIRKVLDAARQESAAMEVALDAHPGSEALKALYATHLTELDAMHVLSASLELLERRLPDIETALARR